MSFRYRKFKVYQDALVLHKLVVFLTRQFPSNFYYLKDQVCRASLSIILNIAEGSGKDSDKDFNRYLKNSLGPINELVSCFEVALMENLVTKSQFSDLENKALEVNNQLGGFSKKLKS